MRRTKIVITLGPATDSPRAIEGLINVGVDVFRLNFSHGTAEDHRKRAKLVRTQAKKLNRAVGILGDLQGPKIRVSKFREGPVALKKGSSFILDVALDENAGNKDRVGVTYKGLANDLNVDDVLVLDDGRIVLKVVSIEEKEIHTKVEVGGLLSDNKGINLKGGGLTAEAIGEKDRRDIALAAELKLDFLAVSFPRSAEDIHLARSLIRESDGKAYIVAKIERAEALGEIDAILEATDAIMVARGDLGVEIGDAELPAVQKDLINRARTANKIVITATQMMESMIENPIPTRAEVFDVANAVLDGTDAVMLSGETAVGKHPVKAVRAMSEICEVAEQHPAARKSYHRLDNEFEEVDESIAMASMYTANHLKVKAIAALTESGRTTRWMSRISSLIPIYALTPHETTCRKVTLYRGVYPVLFKPIHDNVTEINRDVMRLLYLRDKAEKGDLVIITKGDVMGVDGGTSSMKIARMEDWVE